ncbi:MAG: glycosyltransferase family 4 protein [Rhodoglobus sp.]
MSAADNLLVVDNRWSGQHGIGRYAAEVLARLSVPWTPIEPSGKPSSPVDFIRKGVTVNGRKPDLIYSPGYNGFLRQVPQTITVLDLIHLSSSGSAKYRPYYDLFLKPLIKRNGHVITISETSKTEIEQWLGDDRVTVINAGMGRSPEFVPAGTAHTADRPYFLYVGNLRAHKNVDTIVKAIKQVPGADLLVVASDSDGVKALAAEHDVSDRVQTVAGISDLRLAELYRGARATLQPSILEGFGLPALESALCGTPVIFSEQCESVKEICAGGGISISGALDASEWSAAMNGVTEGQRFPAGHVVPEHYSWDSVASTISEVLSERLPR